MAVNWGDRKQVRLLSTCSTTKMGEKAFYNGDVQEILQVIDYNQEMEGVDISDQMTNQYIGEFRTVKLLKSHFSSD